MITGYFMVSQKVRLSKILRFLLEIIFYNLLAILIYNIPQHTFSIPCLVKAVLPVITNRGGFVDTWFFVFLTAPFINKVCTGISKRRYLILLGILCFYFVINGLSSPGFGLSYFSWGIAMYITGAFFRLHPPTIGNKTLSAALFVGILWLWGGVYVGVKLQDKHIYMTYCGTLSLLPCLLASVSIFGLFKRIPTFHSRFVNTIAGGAFGVYLLHDHSGSCRQAIWHDWLPVADFFASAYLIPMIILYCIGIYIAFATIDIIRTKYIERPLFNILNRRIKWLSKEY